MIKLKNISFIWLFIGIILIALFIGQIIEIINLSVTYELNFGISVNFRSGFKLIYYSNRFLILIFSGLALIGVFIPKKIGWIAICSLFYHFTFHQIFVSFANRSASWIDYLLLLIPISFIGLMNFKQILKRFKIIPYSVLLINLITISIALSLTTLRGYLFLNNNLTVWEIIELIK